MAMRAGQIDEVLAFWFDGADDAALSRGRSAWFQRDDAFDADIRQRFLALWESLERGALPFDGASPRAALAWLIVADQFPRNLFRGEARAFATDAQARQGASQALAAGLDQALPPMARVFVYLPFEHSETLADQHRSLELFAALDAQLPGSNFYDYARRHGEVIARFGRFPHRNAALGRTSTAEELSYLAEPGAGF
ncbi:DUF924 family protein [Chromobacterium sp. IIBBL 290-4]|uniref:DUF924 family protein n=1 Tax=Chromobacterium sp. IIBBL 290-4 TaxID=2953890 RepID=UPI0020B64A96|nr:DUF924 family protein [Chromobacterium sp. IIBBL 290-4]UTH74277.1 DUF924 domain-containing protein [Chromobacterium sp. IIBBL 290-4]